MADLINNPLTRSLGRPMASGGRAMGRAAVNPVLARYLAELSRQDRLASEWDALAGAARGMEEIAPPRGPLEPADFGTAIESMIPSRSYEVPFADELRRNDRTRALVDSRLDRLTPEQQASSLGLVGRQADVDARMARRQDVESDMDLATRLLMAGGAGALGVGGGMKMSEEATIDAEQEMLAAAMEAEAAEQLERALKEDVDGILPMQVDLGEEDPIDGEADALLAAMVEDGPIGVDALAEGLADSSYPQEIDVPGLMDEDMEMFLERDTPDIDAMSPEVAVEQQMLPGPQARSIMALMRMGIPEARARDIILKGASMSPDEYRSVTGGRR